MSSLVTHRTRHALEPSAGAGDLLALLEAEHPNLTLDAVELDDSIIQLAATPIVHDDFFHYSASRDGSYDLIFGNPPYVAWKQVEASTRLSAASVKERYSDKTNLYHLFIDRCVDLLAPGGELILIVPKEWLYLTSAAPLRRKLAEQGALTHVIDAGEEKLFSDASVPALLIFRWVKSAPQEPVAFAETIDDAVAGHYVSRTLTSSRDRWMLMPQSLERVISDWGTLSDQYVVRVGLITGLDRAFKLSATDDIEPACVQHQADTSRSLVRFVNVNAYTSEADLPPLSLAHLRPHEAALRARRIAHFTDDNWWKYGAIRNEEHMRSPSERFFALVKTRSPQPFFSLPGAQFFTGGLLGIFRRPEASVSIDTAVALLNSPAYRPVLQAMFLITADKVSLQPSTLMDVPFPRTEHEAQTFLTLARASRMSAGDFATA